MATRLPSQAPAPGYRILLFGPFTVIHNGVVVDASTWPRSAVTLLKLLVTAPGWRRSRDELIDTLWPDSTPEAGSSSLRSALSRLRHGLGGANPSPILYQQGSMELNRAYSWHVDLADLEALLRSVANGGAQPDDAWALCRGEVLEDDQYDDWATATRDHAHRLWRDAALRMARSLGERGDALAAGECLDSILGRDPYDEEALRALLHSLVAAGRRTEAVRRYRLFEQQLREEMDLTPEPETTAILDRIKVQSPLAHGETMPDGAALNEPSTAHAGLPPELTSFVGRADQMSALHRLLARPDVYLVTLTGPGGSGKTRLAAKVARELIPSFPDGVAFVSLAPVADATLVLSTIFAALGIRDTTDRPMQDILRIYFSNKHMLLVLDNLEHLLAAASDIAGLLGAGPRLRILATSRASLHVHGEHEFPVPPLDVPQQGSALESDQLRACASVQLFVERAQAIQPSFSLLAANAATVAAICTRLEGLPLSLELAAARIKIFPPQALLEQLSSRLHLLTDGAIDGPTRQRTLRGTIDWSYSLLSDEETTLFCRLSVFAGGCAFEAAAAVCNANAELDLLEGIASLVDKNLLRQSGEAEARFVMLETIREYAGEKLEERGHRESIQAAHASFFLQLAEEAGPRLASEHQVEWLERLERDHDNVRAALTYLLQQEDSSLALHLAVDMAPFWISRGNISEGRRWLEASLAGASEDTALRARALFALGEVLRNAALFPLATRAYEACRNLGRDLNDASMEASTLSRLALMSLRLGDAHHMSAMFEESLRLFRQVGDARGTIDALYWFAKAVVGTERAMECIREALQLSRDLGLPMETADMLAELGFQHGELGNLDESRNHLEQALELSLRIGHRLGTADALRGLSECARARGEYREAIERAEEALLITRQIEYTFRTVVTLPVLGFALLEDGQVDRARTAFAESLALCRQIGERLMAITALKGLSYCALRTEDYGDAVAHAQEGVELSQELRVDTQLASMLRILDDALSSQAAESPNAPPTR